MESTGDAIMAYVGLQSRKRKVVGGADNSTGQSSLQQPVSERSDYRGDGQKCSALQRVRGEAVDKVAGRARTGLYRDNGLFTIVWHSVRGHSTRGSHWSIL